MCHPWQDGVYRNNLTVRVLGPWQLEGLGRQPLPDLLLPSCTTGLQGGAGAGKECASLLQYPRAESRDPLLAVQFSQIFFFKVHIINYHPALFSFYSLFQAISSNLFSALGQLCLKRFPAFYLSLSILQTPDDRLASGPGNRGTGGCGGGGSDGEWLPWPPVHRGRVTAGT